MEDLQDMFIVHSIEEIQVGARPLAAAVSFVPRGLLGDGGGLMTPEGTEFTSAPFLLGAGGVMSAMLAPLLGRQR